MGKGKVKQKKRANNEGTVYQRPDGTWVSQITTGYHPTTGKPKRRTFYGKTKAEVIKRKNNALVELEKGNYNEPTKITLGEWIREWLNDRKPHLAESTYDVYEMLIRIHIEPTLGRVKLQSLQTRRIQKLLNEKFVNGRVDGKGGLSSRTISFIHQALNGCLNQAVRERIIQFNPAEHCELPKQDYKESDVFSWGQLETFLKMAQEKSPHFAAFYLDIATGLRRGELLGLRWDDIDFANNSISVYRQLVRSKTEGLIFKGLKTKKSKRTIKVDNSVIGVLKMHKTRQNKQKLSLGEIYKDSNLVFCTEFGSPLEPRNFYRHFCLLIEKANLPHTRLHDLRHLYATIALESGVDLKTVSSALGHSSIRLTGDIYAHVTDKMQSKSAVRVGTAIANCSKK